MCGSHESPQSIETSYLSITKVYLFWSLVQGALYKSRRMRLIDQRASYYNKIWFRRRLASWAALEVEFILLTVRPVLALQLFWGLSHLLIHLLIHWILISWLCSLWFPLPLGYFQKVGLMNQGLIFWFAQLESTLIKSISKTMLS